MIPHNRDVKKSTSHFNSSCDLCTFKLCSKNVLKTIDHVDLQNIKLQLCLPIQLSLNKAHLKKKSLPSWQEI